MIYLIRTAHLVINDDNTFTAVPVLKIGYSSDPTGEKRFSTYRSNGPIMVLAIVADRLADGSLERSLHYHFRDYLVYGREWYEDCDDIVNFFKDHVSGEAILNFLETEDPWSLVVGQVPLTKEQEEKAEAKRLINIFPNIADKIERFFEFRDFSERLKYLCTEFPEDIRKDFSRQISTDTTFYRFVSGLELSTIARYSYRKSELNLEVSRLEANKCVEDLVRARVLLTFDLNKVYTKPVIKSKLKEIYADCGYKATAKAVDLSKFFELKECRERGGDSDKRPVVLKIISIKEA